MFNRRHIVAAALIAPLPFTISAMAAGKRTFDQKAFEAAQAAGKPILVEVSAPWCSICRAQAPILERLRSDARFKNMVSFDVDFDSRKDVLRQFKASSQSTLIVFKGKQEVGRSTGDTRAASIDALLSKAL